MVGKIVVQRDCRPRRRHVAARDSRAVEENIFFLRIARQIALRLRIAPRPLPVQLAVGPAGRTRRGRARRLAFLHPLCLDSVPTTLAKTAQGWGSHFVYDAAEIKISQSWASPRIVLRGHRLELREDLTGLLVVYLAGEQAVQDLGQSALYGGRVSQRRGFEPTLAFPLSNFSRFLPMRTLMGVAVSRAAHGGRTAAGGVVHPVLA